MLIFVRHGERADNCPIEKHQIINKSDPHLTKVGTKQAEMAGQLVSELCQQFKSIKLMSSPFLRCYMTANAISNKIGTKEIILKTQLCEALYETYFKEDPLKNLLLNTQTSDHIDCPIVNDQLNDPQYYPEDYHKVTKRVLDYTQELLDSLNHDECLVLVTHQRPIKSIIEHFDKDSTDVGYCKVVGIKKDNRLNLSDCSIIIN